MGLSKAHLSKERDVFIDYDIEQVKFRWEAATCKIFRKFYGEEESLSPVEHSNRLFFEALSFGDSISAVEYHKGRLPY